MQDAHTLHKQMRRRFPRNPYTANNLLDFWVVDLVDFLAFSKFNDN